MALRDEDEEEDVEEDEGEGKEEERERVATTELFADVIYEPKQPGMRSWRALDEDDEESQTAEARAPRHGARRIGCCIPDADRGDESNSR